MKIGYLQCAPALCDLNATLGTLDALLPRAAEADLLVLPELCNSGYNFPSREEAFAAAEATDDSSFIRYLIHACKTCDMHIVSGFNERQGDRLYNSAVLVGPDGLEGLYRKMHLFLDEKSIFEPGDLGFPVFQCRGITIGMLVCFDWIFPESWRMLALSGAEVVCHPSNLVLPGLAQRAVPINALMNRVFAVTANRIGSEGELNFTGRSIIVNPKGDLLSEAPAEDEAVAIVEIDPALARDKKATPRNDLFADRRPGFYGKLLS